MEALLILGPTGAGKTPLGDMLAEKGFRGRRCFHFDFGMCLRRVAAGAWLPEGLTPADVSVVRNVVYQGELLENETFNVAETILAEFVEQGGMGLDDLVVLNGLPRHVDQAHDVDDIVEIIAVVSLECAPHTVYARIRSNAGGDRAERVDDSEAEIAARLGLYNERTLPLLDYYASQGIPIHRLTVEAATRPEQLIARLETGAS